MMQSFGSGVRDAAAGWRFIAARPRLYKWVAAPAMLALVVVVAVIWGAVALTDPAIAWLVGFIPDFLERWVSGLLTFVLIAVLALAGFFVYVSLVALVSAPFNEMLSEAIEHELTGTAGRPFSVATLLRDVALGVAHASRRVFTYLVVMGLLLLASLLLPVIGQAIYVAGGLIATARFAAYDALDAVMARKGLAYADKMAYLKRQRARSFGLGAAVAGLMAVPVVNLLALSVGAAGATLLWCEDQASSTGRSNT